MWLWDKNKKLCIPASDIKKFWMYENESKMWDVYCTLTDNSDVKLASCYTHNDAVEFVDEIVDVISKKKK